MRDEGLLTIDFNTKTHSFVLVYEPDSEFVIEQIIAYVEEASLGKCRDIMVYEGQHLTCEMIRRNGKWVDAADFGGH